MLQRLTLSSFRNYQQAEFVPGAGVNLVVGDNGSGKSSLLEAIYLLGSGRSFRTSRLQRLVRESAQDAVLFAEVLSHQGVQHRLGMARNRQGFSGLKLDGVNVRGLSDLARILPVQAFHPGTVEIVEGPSSARRRYLDWGLFHVEQSFLPLWRQLYTALQQRNRLLRSGRFQHREMLVWDQQVATVSGRISQLRSAYLTALSPHLQTVLGHIGELPEVNISLYAGWPDGEDLLALLAADIEKDRQRGHTGRGAHRAELRLTTAAGPVRDVFSRGQTKTLSYALLLAQLYLLVHGHGGQCLVLVDDLASELDSQHSAAVLAALKDLKQQMIITALSADALPVQAEGNETRMFHVEHGVLKRLD
jgi:DNA replication and repair protein RecF